MTFNSSRRLRVVITALSIPLLLHATAQAQMTNPAPRVVPNTLPGAILDDSKSTRTGKPIGVEPADNKDKDADLPEGKESVDNQIEQPKLDPSLKRPLQITKIKVEGVTKLTPEEVNAIVGPWEGKEASLQDLQENVSDKLTELYEKKGYITSLVYIPPQKIEEGVIVIRADEGVVSELLLENTRWFGKWAIMPRVAVHKGEVFESKPLLKTLRRVNENPDITLQATLKAGNKPGETRVILSPKEEHFPIHVSPFFDNLGRFPIGRQRLGVTVSDNNTFGLGDTSYVSPYFTTHSWGLLSGYELPLGAHGTKIGFSQGHTQFDFNQAGFNFEGRSNVYLPYIAQEIYRNERVLLSADLGFAAKNSTFLVNDVGLSQDRIRVLTPGINFRTFDKTGQFYMRHELGIGLDIMDATIGTTTSPKPTSRVGAGSQFVRYTTSVTRMQKLPWHTYGIFKMLGQLSPHELVALEQFQLGGATTVRGFREGRLIGDSGLVLSAEWRIPWWFLPDRWAVKGYKLKDNMEFVTFMDMGAVFDERAAVSGVNPQSGFAKANAFAWSTGVGLRARIAKYLNARLDVGVPLNRQTPDKNDLRLHFGLESRIF